MKTAISLPDAMFEAADRMARRLGISRSELVQRALRQYLDDHSQAGLTEALDSVYAEDPSAGEVNSLLQKFQLDSLAREDW